MLSSLTGDPITDQLVPIAQQLIGAVRHNDRAAVEQAFTAARAVLDGGDPGAALAVITAAMVPENVEPTQLLKWWGYRAEYDRLVAAGVDERTAGDLVAYLPHQHEGKAA